jgi:predicted CoA-binding protein
MWLNKKTQGITMQTIDQNLIDEFLDKKNIFAVIGVSKDSKKYGNKVYFDLKRAGYNVYPVNPNVSEVSGEKCYPKLKNLPTLPDVVDTVVHPKITEEIVKECKNLGIDKVWMQPGSESKKAIRFCIENDIKVLYGICVMIERRKDKRSE